MLSNLILMMLVHQSVAMESERLVVNTTCLKLPKPSNKHLRLSCDNPKNYHCLLDESYTREFEVCKGWVWICEGSITLESWVFVVFVVLLKFLLKRWRGRAIALFYTYATILLILKPKWFCFLFRWKSYILHSWLLHFPLALYVSWYLKSR